MRAVKLILCTAYEMSEIDLVFRDALMWDPALEAKLLRTDSGDVAFKKIPSSVTAGTAEHSQKAAWDHIRRWG